MDNIKRRKQIAVRYDDKGEIVEVLDIVSDFEEQVNEIKTTANKNSLNREVQAKKKEEEETLYKMSVEKGRKVKNLIIAKLMFNDMVERGKAHTTKEFEEAFDKFMLGAELNLEVAPQMFKEVLLRVGA